VAKPKQKPILLKIAPDLTNEQLDIIDVFAETKIAGVIARPTLHSRRGYSQLIKAKWEFEGSL
jgi:dihydroorotate dehydrogenase